MGREGPISCTLDRIRRFSTATWQISIIWALCQMLGPDQEYRSPFGLGLQGGHNLRRIYRPSPNPSFSSTMSTSDPMRHFLPRQSDVSIPRMACKGVCLSHRVSDAMSSWRSGKVYIDCEECAVREDSVASVRKGAVGCGRRDDQNI